MTMRARVVTLEGPALAPAPRDARGGATPARNVAERLAETARRRPAFAAVIEPDGRRGWRTISYRDLDARVDAIAHGLVARGVVPGDRVAVFVRPGATLVALAFALFRLGAVPVLLDPGMGRRHVIACLARMRPRVFLGTPLAHVLRAWHARELPSIEIALCVGGPAWPGLERLERLERPSAGAYRAHAGGLDDAAAVLFTSGSTGPPKGVVYTHVMFAAQIAALRALYEFRAGEVDLACFPLFALFDAALETTCVQPRLDPLRPAHCDPAAIADALLAHGCTYGFGSPAIWKRVTPWAVERGVTFDVLERVLIAGAPVPAALVADLRTRLTRGDVHTPYGATECLPVSSVSGAELATRRARVEGGHGSCVGRPAPGIAVRIDGAANPADVGEILVHGPVVKRAYAEDPAASARALVVDDDGRAWHRTGDAGYVDGDGYLWTVGRTAHRVDTDGGVRWPVPIENVCDRHPRARRTALVPFRRNGRRGTCLVIEPTRDSWPTSTTEQGAFADEMRALVAASLTAGSPAAVEAPDAVRFHRSFPVDVRHNAKIRREDLAAWVEEGA